MATGSPTYRTVSVASAYWGASTFTPEIKGFVRLKMSLPVITVIMPGKASAFSLSILRMSACAMGDRRNAA